MHKNQCSTFNIIIRTYVYTSFVASSVTNAVVVPNAPNATNGLNSITVICTIHPNSTADQCVVRAVDDVGINRTGMCIILSTIIRVATVLQTCMYIIQYKCVCTYPQQVSFWYFR